jgi:hypothetical protein
MFVQSLCFFCFKIQWIGANQQSGGRVPINRKRGPHVNKTTVASAHFIARFIGFYVLVHVVELDVPASGRDLGVVVVFHVIGA